VIDIDRMDEQLAAALTGGTAPGARSPGPAPARAPAPARRTPRVTSPSPAPTPRPAPRPASAAELLALGLVEEADATVAAGAHPRDALTWSTMRALMGGRRDSVRTGIDELRRLAERTDDPQAHDHHWLQRFWAAFEWGTDEERYDTLDHCRERAYRFDDVPWWGNLTLLLAAMGKQDEAVRAFDTIAPGLPALSYTAAGLDVITNCVEAAALLHDAGRAAAAAEVLPGADGRLVVVGAGVVCKGAVDRYRALGLAATGRWAEAGERFRGAEAMHRAIGAEALLAQTLRQAAGPLVAA
jgi:hypothetical protein